MNPLEQYFKPFRENIIGIDQTFISPFGQQKIVYGDWIASGRLYRTIEDKMINTFGPFVGNTHTETSETGTLMTNAYHLAHKKIKEHVNAGPGDVIITAGSGMTTVINKLQRILGFRTFKKNDVLTSLPEEERPVVFITHMEHHSNHTSWFETIADVIQLKPDDNLLVDIEELRKALEKYKARKMKIGSFTACSNVTGISTPYYEMAKLMHEYGGICFVDFAASAPYVKIDMHPEDPMMALDAIMFSPHKFLGGPGTSGVLVFNSALYNNPVPDNPGGGTVDWTNPWGEFKYVDDIEAREDGGTPPFLQTIKAALCIELKNKMGVENIEKREKQLVKMAFEEMVKIPGIKILADNVTDRLGVFSFYFNDIHFNLAVKLLNDKFGIQVRGGCACAGTYGHFLLDVSYDKSKHITDLINHGDLSQKPGWIRLSLHPTMTDEELFYIIDALKSLKKNHHEWSKQYIYNCRKNEFRHFSEPEDKSIFVKDWFKL
ncbi:MAG TPA: aminotransferase class V-fold PLP-dependent enzyme [Bacteroidales bacterium]|jgi:selenocysteine lyase/cysteine desulfurase|nr:aminotransferase class V-fold PLP-dependent enzyme [Bacteroidales bacterium]OQC37216.1 MAG: putative cysteine desulfurase [Bacteroidetes bacterium ADurb.Bin041]MBP7873719.1 aminotransferase class V-fold PLP-dependent enzyme [Bacteroidales bacterium]HNV50571.1 aminotransferase class V-fold PLP-dependent enzyme [Bacteroidales bacterium]HNY59999.1 aminotransferase class V-fold PLP-dependent enzyme [Bacteroidales bacterium]